MHSSEVWLTTTSHLCLGFVLLAIVAIAVCCGNWWPRLMSHQAFNSKYLMINHQIWAGYLQFDFFVDNCMLLLVTNYCYATVGYPLVGYQPLCSTIDHPYWYPAAWPTHVSDAVACTGLPVLQHQGAATSGIAQAPDRPGVMDCPTIHAQVNQPVSQWINQFIHPKSSGTSKKTLDASRIFKAPEDYPASVKPTVPLMKPSLAVTQLVSSPASVAEEPNLSVRVATNTLP